MRIIVSPEELKVAIERTKVKIYELKRQIEVTEDPKEKRRLKRLLKETQYLQLWHLDQLGWKQWDWPGVPGTGYTIYEEIKRQEKGQKQPRGY